MSKTFNSAGYTLTRIRGIVVFLMMFPLCLMAQNINITGTVTDANTGEEVIGATVKVKGSSGGTITDAMGSYKLSVKPGVTIEVSYVGYQTRSVKVTKAGQLDIQISEDVNMLEQVVVVGYGVMKRSDLTGSVASIDEKAIKQGVNTSIEQAMQGRIAGVQVMQNSGAPGGGISVQIRGINSLNGNEPLYVVDGIAMSGQTSDNTSVMSSLNPSDITSIEVLKDASATAIYGSRASNGVVLITTKRGSEGKAKITYEGYVGWQSLPKYLDVMNLPEYANFYNERSLLLYGEDSYMKNINYSDPYLMTNGTDWQKEIFQTAFMHNHQLGVTGGSKTFNYSLSGGYLDQEGIQIGSSFERASFRANIEAEVYNWLRVGVNGYFAKTEQEVKLEDGTVINTVLDMYPDVPARNADGSFGYVPKNDFATYYTNPLMEASLRENNRQNSQLDYNIYANITPVKGLVVRLEYGGSRGWGDTYFFSPDYMLGDDPVRSEGSRGSLRNEYNSFKQYATYDFDLWQGHHFQVMAGHEAQWGSWSQLSAGRKDYISNIMPSLNFGDVNTATNSENGGKWAIESYYGRLNYNLLDRYLLTATLRTDGSSRLGKNNRWGWFPSVAAAWRISQEPFMKNLTWVNNLKLRLGWGLVGNQNAGDYAYGVSMKTTATAWGTGYYAGNFQNQNLKWESTRAWNVGLDMSFLNNRIEFIVDAYLKNTDNLLMQAALPSYVINNDWMGITSPWVNTGAIENKGIEFTLNTVNISSKNFQWRTGITLSINRNKIKELNSETGKISGTATSLGSGTYTLSEIGGPVGRFYGYNVIGMYKDASDFYQKNSLGEFILDANGDKVRTPCPIDPNTGLIAEPNKTKTVWVGDYIFEDVNGDGIITEADRKYIGDPNPDFTFGINNTITWKDFELSFFLNGSIGNDVYNYLRQQHTSFDRSWGNKLKEAANFAQLGMIDPEGDDTDVNNFGV